MPSRLSLRLLALAVLSIAALALACSDDSSDDGSDAATAEPTATGEATPATDEPTATTEEASSGGQALGAVEALRLSTERNQEVQSFRGRFTMEADMGGFSLEMGGDYEFEAPDRMHMTMSIFGEEMEMLMLPPDIYMNLPGQGWYGGSIDDLGVDYEALTQYAEQRGPLDYADFVSSLDNSTQLPDETIDGVRYLRYQGEVDVNKAIYDLPEGIIDPSLLDTMGGTFLPMGVDLWLHPDSYLPYRTDITMIFAAPDDTGVGGDFSMTMSMTYASYNEPVQLPEPPANAQPLPGLEGAF